MFISQSGPNICCCQEVQTQVTISKMDIRKRRGKLSLKVLRVNKHSPLASTNAHILSLLLQNHC